MPARRPTALRAVTADEKPLARRRPAQKSVTVAAKGGVARELLVAMRDRIAIAVEDQNTPARDLAALTKRLMEVVRDIEAADARAAEEAKERAATPDEEWDAQAL